MIYDIYLKNTLHFNSKQDPTYEMSLTKTITPGFFIKLTPFSINTAGMVGPPKIGF
jgi:hypothetical protein